MNVLSELFTTCEKTSSFNLEVENRDMEEGRPTDTIRHTDCTAEHEDDGWTLVTSKKHRH